MKGKIKCSLVALLATLAMSCSTETKTSLNEGGLLWRISGNGSDSFFYILGTHHGMPHVQDPHLLDSIYLFNSAMAHAKLYVGDVDYLSAMTGTDTNAMVLPADTCYQDLLSNKEIEILNRTLQKYIGTDCANVKMRPAYLGGMIRTMQGGTDKLYDKDLGTGIEYQSIQNQMPIDWALQARAAQVGCVTANMEKLKTIDTVRNALANEARYMMALICPKAELDTLRTAESDALLRAYNNQDMLAIEDALLTMIDCEESDSKWTAKVSKECNEDLLWEIAYRTDRIESSLVSLDIRYLAHEHGVLNLLRQKGYTVDAVM